MTRQALVLVLLAGLNSCLGNILLKKSQGMTGAFVDRLLTPAFAGGVFFYGINVLLFAKALESAPVSIAYPILAGSAFLLVAIASAVFLGEVMSVSKASGMALIVVGIVLLARDA